MSRFYGIAVQMFFKEHGIPHFHARYGEQIAVFAIEPLELLRGSLPGRAERLVREWTQLHQEELLRNWQQRSRRGTARADRTTPMNEIHDIVYVEVTGDHTLRVGFDDGAAREVSLEAQLDGPVFEPLRDPQMFAQVEVDRAMGTVTWPTGADLDPIVIYEGLPPLYARVVREAAA